MMTPRKNAPRPGNLHAKIEKSNRPNVIDPSTFSNSEPVRQLIRCQDDVLLYQLKLGRSTSFEVVSPIGESWPFSLLYQAENKWVRLLAKTGGGAR